MTFFPSSDSTYFLYRKKHTDTHTLYVIFRCYVFTVCTTCVQTCHLDKNLFSCEFGTSYRNNFFALWRFYISYFFSYAFGGVSMCLRFKSKYFLLAPLPARIIQLWVGYSHLTFLASSLIFFKKVSQYLILFYSRDVFLISQATRACRNFKNYNCYTMRGIRMSHDKFQRRLGKIKRFL